MHKQGKIYKNIHYSVWVYLTLSKSIEYYYHKGKLRSIIYKKDGYRSDGTLK